MLLLLFSQLLLLLSGDRGPGGRRTSPRDRGWTPGESAGRGGSSRRRKLVPRSTLLRVPRSQGAGRRRRRRRHRCLRRSRGTPARACALAFSGETWSSARDRSFSLPSRLLRTVVIRRFGRHRVFFRRSWPVYHPSSSVTVASAFFFLFIPRARARVFRSVCTRVPVHRCDERLRETLDCRLDGNFRTAVIAASAACFRLPFLFFVFLCHTSSTRPSGRPGSE